MEHIDQKIREVQGRLTFEETKQSEKDTYSIYQLKDGDETWAYRFEPLDRLKRVGLHVDRSHYNFIYSGSLEKGETLEDLYRRFNLDHPEDFRGHSLSVSDIVVLCQAGKVTAHYCDSFGFAEVPEFLVPEKKQARDLDLQR